MKRCGASPVSLPHDAMRTEERVAASTGEGNIGWFEGGDYEYVKKFTPDAELAGKKLVLEFESVYHNAEVWVNGQKAMYRPYGYTNFYVELNDFLVDGENEIRVIARNADQPNSRWYSGTGIFRPVWLWAADEKHIKLNGVKIETLSILPAKIRVRVETSVPGDVSVEILGGENTVASARGSGEFEDYKTNAPEDRIRGGTCRIDVTGKMTPEVDYTKVAFELCKGPFLAVYPACETEKPGISGWQLTRAMRSWSYPGCDGQETDIEVYARAALVELFINGKSVGKKKPKKAIAKFRAVYENGEICAVSYNARHDGKCQEENRQRYILPAADAVHS